MVRMRKLFIKRFYEFKKTLKEMALVTSTPAHILINTNNYYDSFGFQNQVVEL